MAGESLWCSVVYCGDMVIMEMDNPSHLLAKARGAKETQPLRTPFDRTAATAFHKKSGVEDDLFAMRRDLTKYVYNAAPKSARTPKTSNSPV